MISRKTGTVLALIPLVLLAAGCSRTGEIDPTGGITAVRSACPEVGIPAGTGDITMFDPADSRLASAIDVTATMTHVRSTCTESNGQVLTNVTFDIEARRSSASGARDVTFPYFVTVVRGGNAVVAKRTAQATVHFDAGQMRAQASATGSTTISQLAATLPEDIRKKITEKRKAGQEDAAIDPLSEPSVRAAIARVSFEALVGFQLTSDQLKYNLTR